MRDLGVHLHKIELPRPNRYMRLIFVIPPSKRADAKTFTASDMEMLGNAVDGFSLMTYDYSNMYRPGPNAPLPWLKACLHLLIRNKREDSMHGSNLDEENPAFKILMGLNFYGNDFLNPQGIIPSSPSIFSSVLHSLFKFSSWFLGININIFLPVFFQGVDQSLVMSIFLF